METKRVILARFVDFDVHVDHGNRLSDFQKNSLLVEKFMKNQF